MMDLFAWWNVLFFLLGPITCLMYWFLTRHFNYWKDRNVLYAKPTLFFGSVKEVILKQTSWKLLFDQWYLEFKNVGIGGAFFLRKPIVIVCDLEMVKKILVEDFDYFRDKLPEYDSKLSTSTSLSHSSGERWKELHLKIAPTFSSLKIKGMMEQIIDCTKDIMTKIDSNIEKSLQIENISFLYVSEAIASCSFGVKLFADTGECQEFQNILELITDPSFTSILFYNLVTFYPKIVNLLKIELLPNKVTKLIFKMTSNIIKLRKGKKNRRNDYLQILLDLKDQEDINIKSQDNIKREKLFTDQSISMLMFNFLMVGLKPTSSTINFALFEIAKNHSISEKLHREIDEATKHDGWTFQCFQKMSYLDQVIKETLRLHCYNLSLFRIVKKDYLIPRTGLVLEEGLFVYIPIQAIHMDPEYYPDPEVFNPDRFYESDNNLLSFLPFGTGPRMCIAVKFAMLIMKSFLARLLFDYTVSISEKMVVPLEYEQQHFYPKAKGGIWLEFARRKHL